MRIFINFYLIIYLFWFQDFLFLFQMLCLHLFLWLFYSYYFLLSALNFELILLTIFLRSIFLVHAILAHLNKKFSLLLLLSLTALFHGISLPHTYCVGLPPIGLPLQKEALYHQCLSKQVHLFRLCHGNISGCPPTSLSNVFMEYLTQGAELF